MTNREWKALEQLVAILTPRERSVLIAELHRMNRELEDLAKKAPVAVARMVARRARDLRAARDFVVEQPPERNAQEGDAR